VTLRAFAVRSGLAALGWRSVVASIGWACRWLTLTHNNPIRRTCQHFGFLRKFSISGFEKMRRGTPKARYRVRNWPAHNANLINRGNVTV